MAQYHAPARHIGLRPRARSRARSAISGKTSSWPASSAIWTISMLGLTLGGPRSPTLEFTPPPGAWWTRPLPRQQPSLKPLPATPYSAVLTVERRVSKDGMISVGGNFYSVPDTTRRRTLKVQHHATELRIYEDGQLIARHPVLEGKARRRVDPTHRKAPPPRPFLSRSSHGLRRPLDFYGAVGQRLAAEGARS